MKKLIMMRGLPGSGKSTLAASFGGVCISTDDYFMAGDKYLFNPSEIGLAHAWNQRRCQKLMDAATPIIVVDNTNIQLWEMRTYVEMAAKLGYKIEFAAPLTGWCGDPVKCAAKNRHSVPIHVIEGMKRRFEAIPSDLDEYLDNDDDVAAVLASVSPFAKKK